MLHRYYNPILYLCVIGLSILGQARDLGVIGPVWPISECDMLVWIEKKISIMQENGRWQALQQHWKRRVQQQAFLPAAVDFLTPSLGGRTWYVTPAFYVEQDIYDMQHHKIAVRGTTINPMERPWCSYYPMVGYVLLFMDIRDKRQKIWGEKQLAFWRPQQKRIKIILTGGSVKKATKWFNTSVYFDQFGRLSRRFELKHTPAMVRNRAASWQVVEGLYSLDTSNASP